MSRVYIQRVEKQFPDDWAYAAWYGFKELGFSIEFFENIHDIKDTCLKQDVIVAFIQDTYVYFEHIGLDMRPMNIPECLMPFAKRKIGCTTVGELINNTSKFKFPLFIKPMDRTKEFVNGVLSGKDIRFLLSDANPNSRVFTSEVVEFISEYRGFVYDGKLVGLKHYQGEFKYIVNYEVIEKAVNVFNQHNPPIAYTIDFGLTKDFDTVIVECNDAWSIGNYGLDAKLYAKMLRDRWKEIMKNFVRWQIIK